MTTDSAHHSNPPTEPLTAVAAPVTLSEFTQPHRSVFLFVNPTSGGNAAAAFTSPGLEQISLKDPSYECFIFDIRDGASGHKPGFKFLKQFVDTTSPSADERATPVIACGGDGTIMWTMTEMTKHGVDVSKICVGCVPYGTGNDFSRVLSWQIFAAAHPYANDLKTLRKMVMEWDAAPEVFHDVWTLEFILHENGLFQKINSSTRKKEILRDGNEHVKSKIFHMNNYFSIGVDARIGIGFDRHRTKTTFGNKMVYVNEGFKKLCFKRVTPIDRILRKLTSQETAGPNQEDLTIFDNSSDTSSRKLKPCATFLISNIPSFASGLDIWNSCTNKPLGVTGNSSDAQFVNLKTVPQKLGDGKLEFITFPNTFGLEAEQGIGGHGRRVFQGPGPFQLDFQNLEENERVYFQVDGEFYIMHCPATVTVRREARVKLLARAASPKAESYVKVADAPPEAFSP